MQKPARSTHNIAAQEASMARLLFTLCCLLVACASPSEPDAGAVPGADAGHDAGPPACLLTIAGCEPLNSNTRCCAATGFPVDLARQCLEPRATLACAAIPARDGCADLLQQVCFSRSTDAGALTDVVIFDDGDSRPALQDLGYTRCDDQTASMAFGAAHLCP
jgi:hypothetical protein